MKMFKKIWKTFSGAQPGRAQGYSPISAPMRIPTQFIWGEIQCLGLINYLISGEINGHILHSYLHVHLLRILINSFKIVIYQLIVNSSMAFLYYYTVSILLCNHVLLFWRTFLCSSRKLINWYCNLSSRKCFSDLFYLKN